MTKRLTERLLDLVEFFEVEGMSTRASDVRDAIAEIARLRVALRPFAELGEPFMRDTENDDSVWVSCADAMEIYFGRPSVPGWKLTVGQLRAAARVFTAGEE